MCESVSGDGTCRCSCVRVRVVMERVGVAV